MTARIYQPARSSMTSGQGKTKGWIVEFPSNAERPVDPLMGWTGQTDMQSQIKMQFATKEAAVDYANRHGVTFVIEEPQKRRHRPRGYGDNFAFERREPWSH